MDRIASGEQVVCFTPELAATLPVRVIGLEFGTSGLEQALEWRITAQEEHDRWSPAQTTCVRQARDICLWLHRSDKRSDGGVGNDHILRTTLRLMRDFEVTDPDQVIGMLYHDAVEDHPGRILHALRFPNPDYWDAQSAALAALTAQSSVRAAGFVGSLTFPELPACTVQRQIAYRDLTLKVLKNPLDQPRKLSDFFDNGVENHYTLDLAKRLKADLKQIACYNLHIDALLSPASIIAPHRINSLLVELITGRNAAAERLQAAHASGLIERDVWVHTLQITQNLFGLAN